MCEREIDPRLLSLNSQCRYLGVFLNLGLIQGERKMGEQAHSLCDGCRSLLDEIKMWVFENTDIFYTLDREIEKRETEEFARELWPSLFKSIMKDGSTLNEGRLFALLMCLTRAGMIWKVKGFELSRIQRVYAELQHFLKTHLPNYNWILFSRFVQRMQTVKNIGYLEALGKILRRLLAWKLLGER